MTEDLTRQVSNHINTAKQAAILLSTEPTLDAVCSAFALQAAIAAQGGNAAIFSASKSLPSLPFFDHHPQVLSSINSAQEFAIKISNTNAKAGELRYDMESDGVVIYLKPKEGQFKATDVSVTPAFGKPDVIFTLGVSSPEQLGELYTSNPNLFFENPVVNIDLNPSNEYFGAINAVNINSASLAEYLMDIISVTSELLQQDIVSTGLLAGIIEQTQSFRSQKTTPVTLSKAAQLIEAGARQQAIIQHLFKTKPFSVLQLWGRALARLATVPEKSLLYSGLTKADMERTQGTPETLVEVLRDLIDMVSDFQVIALAAEVESGIELLIAGLPHINFQDIVQQLGASSTDTHNLVGKYKYVHVTLPGKPLAELQQQLVQALPNQ